MSAPYVKFNVEDKKEFFDELRKRVNSHFTENKISKHANSNMWAKTAFMLLLYFTPFVLMVTGAVTGLWPVIGLWVLMGFGMSGIGLSVMHDADQMDRSGSYPGDTHPAGVETLPRRSDRACVQAVCQRQD